MKDHPNHPVTDEFIAQRWPEIDTPEGRGEIRRQFDALMEQIRNAAWKPFPRFHDHMASIVVEKSRTLPDRLNNLKAALAGIPPHLLKYQWKADERPHFGNKSVRVEPTDIAGDDGHGFGRQWIARVNHVSKNYVGTLADFIAAANPDTVGMMIARIEHLESILLKAQADGKNEEHLTPEEAWTILCETPDITSPEEYPDHALITFEQLRSFMERAQAVPEGCQIVPKEPTEEMKTAGLKTTGMPENTYRDMLAAARGEAIDEDAWL
ncbi:hypothetical protein O8B93_26175 [Agrobacterium rhizogenes]|uniref:hypothetical protein n=1 Tax=Rhizobium rhizogenes TaxID=359 RepID=UPI0022B6EA08|nr:hypothetical protein [Rhizobium rhizogenes]MCZ7451060.1 hypothetical protein [Rhizobium rhizogenes]